MRGNGGTLRVRNLAQKVLWDEELTGQLSDGRWENSRPNDHWEPWCDATVVVDPDNVGRDFWVRRDGYCFTEKDLLEIIGERMISYVRIATGDASYSEKDMLRDLRDLRKIIKVQVSRDLPVPPQPKGRDNPHHKSFDVDPYKVYTPATDVDREAAAERARERELQDLAILEREYTQARDAADKVGAKLEKLRAKLGASV